MWAAEMSKPSEFFIRQNELLEAERDRLKVELESSESLVHGNEEALKFASREIARLKAELEHLSCPICGSDVGGNNWKSKAERYEKTIEKIRALPQRLEKCPCFNIAQKALRDHDKEGV